MEAISIENAIANADRALAAGESLKDTGFWSAVASVKTSPELVDRYADRLAVIDSEAFERWALVSIPVGVGTSLMVLGSVVGLALIGFGYSLDGIWAVLAMYAGFGFLVTTTHGLAHLVVGRLGRIRFTKWFIASVKRPQPGVKIDYASYLRARPRWRAWMHASGALASKTVPFLVAWSAFAAELPAWAGIGLIVIGLGMIVTDILWSATSSDWKKFRREIRFARQP